MLLLWGNILSVTHGIEEDGQNWFPLWALDVSNRLHVYT